MDQAKKELISSLEKAFENLDPNWNKDPDLYDLYVSCGKSAVNYANSKSIFLLLENVIGLICDQKKEKKIEPPFAIDVEVLEQARILIKDYLKNMSDLDMISKHPTAKGSSYHLKDYDKK
jgi:hypothetical protein